VANKIYGLPYVLNECIEIWNQITKVVVPTRADVIGLSKAPLIQREPAPGMALRHGDEGCAIVQPSVKADYRPLIRLALRG